MKMNKKLLASLVAVGILSTGTAFAAANPFDDVPKDHWSYDAVQTLTDDGIVDGYGDNTYRGDKLMTRYEMAQIVGRAVSQSKKADATQKATIDKLAAEYSAELQSLGVRVGNVEKKTAGVQDLKISHWMQMENTYGHMDDYSVSEDGKVTREQPNKEYMLKYRLQFEKQISPKLSVLHQLETKTDYSNMQTQHDSDSHDGVITRLAYATYKPDDKTVINFGKNAFWFAGGMLGDDYIEGLDISRKIGDNTTLQAVTGRYWVKSSIKTGVKDVWGVDADGNPKKSTADVTETDTNQITYIGLNSKLGMVDVGAHYITGQYSVHQGGFQFDRTATTDSSKTKIWGLTAGSDLGKSGVNLSLGYAKNTEAKDSNQMMKVQLYKKMGKTDVFVQYWKEGQNINLPMENGNHMAWWGDQYRGDGLKGFRLIAVHPWSANSYSEFFYGDYKSLKNDTKGQKYGFSITFTY